MYQSIFIVLAVSLIVTHIGMWIIRYRPIFWKWIDYGVYALAIAGVILGAANARRVKFSEDIPLTERRLAIYLSMAEQRADVEIRVYELSISAERSTPEKHRKNLAAYESALVWFNEVAVIVKHKPDTAALKALLQTKRDPADNETTWKDKTSLLRFVGDAHEHSGYLDLAREMASATPFEIRLIVVWPAFLVIALSIGIAKVTANLLGYTTAKETS